MSEERRLPRLPTAARVLAVIPVYGHVRMTHDLLGDLARERTWCDVAVVDNRGDYRPAGDELVLRPGTNLGWAGGINYGTALAGGRYGHLLWLNNDTRLSDGFVRHLLEAATLTRAGVAAPFYDCHWPHQRDLAMPAVEGYRPRRKHYRAAFVDGTAMLVSRRTVRQLGLLDEETFAPLGWGAEIDYCLRAGRAGTAVVVTRQAYLHHLRAVTAVEVLGDYGRYVERAHPASIAGLERKWGPDWASLAGIDPDTFATRPTTEASRIHPIGMLGRPGLRRALRAARSRLPDRVGDDGPAGS